MKITVTGGSGFLGSHVADELSLRGHKVSIFDKKKSKWIKKNQKMYFGDILSFKLGFFNYQFYYFIESA